MKARSRREKVEALERASLAIQAQLLEFSKASVDADRSHKPEAYRAAAERGHLLADAYARKAEALEAAYG